MRKHFFIFVCMVLGGCTCAEPFDEVDSAEGESVVYVGESAYERNIAEGEYLEAICYNGVCYYGLVMTEIIEKGKEPEGFIYLGKISSVKEDYESPTEELGTTVFEVGEDVYYYVDEDGYHNFCVPIGGEKYKGIYIATTQKPDYYD